MRQFLWCQIACITERRSAEIITTLLEQGAFPNYAGPALTSPRSGANNNINNYHNNSNNNPSLTPRPLEVLVGSKYFESGDPGENYTASASGNTTATTPDPQHEENIRQQILFRKDYIVAIIRQGGRLSTKRLVKAPFASDIIPVVQAAEAEWGAKVQANSAASSSNIGGGSGDLSGHVPVDRDDWVKDKDKNGCQLCRAAFTLTFRRHHCRRCGALVCSNCSSKKLVFVGVGSEQVPKPDRACDACFNYCFALKGESPVLATQTRSPIKQKSSSTISTGSSKPKKDKEAEDRAELGLDMDNDRLAARQKPQAGMKKGEARVKW